MAAGPRKTRAGRSWPWTLASTRPRRSAAWSPTFSRSSPRRSGRWLASERARHSSPSVSVARTWAAAAGSLPRSCHASSRHGRTGWPTRRSRKASTSTVSDQPGRRPLV